MTPALEIKHTAQFKKDYKKLRKRGREIERLQEVVALLMQGLPLPPKYHDHALTGNYKGQRECHLRPDWLLIYFIDPASSVVVLVRTGTHSDLFSR